MFMPFSRRSSTAVHSVILVILSTAVVGTATAQHEGGTVGDWTWLIPTDRIEAPQEPGPSGDYGRNQSELPPIVVDERRAPNERSRRPRTEVRERERDRPGRGDRGRDDRDRQDRRDDEVERDRGERRGDVENRRGRRTRGQAGPPHARRGEGAGAAKGGPPFCRSGAGHPVFGMEWCREKGFAAGPDRRRYERDRRRDERRRPRERERRYERRPSLEDIIFGRTERGWDGRLSERQLEDVLGRRLLHRFGDLGYQLGLTGDLHGRWRDTDRGEVLQLSIGSQPLAVLADTDWDGRVDRAVVAQPR